MKENKMIEKTPASKTCYRFVKEDMTSDKDGITKWEIGKWNKVTGELKCCANGLHASLTPLQSLDNIYGDRWFIAEYKGKIDKEDNKFCASEMRLIKEIPIMVFKRFALFCAKDCLKYYEKEYPNDNRVSECIRITELYLDGKANLDELMKAERDADSAWASAWAWAWAWARASACASAWARACASARASARVSARVSARQEKELKRLIKEYAR